MSRRLEVRDNPDVFGLASAGVILAVGWALLSPGEDGQSALSHMLAAVKSANSLGALLPGTQQSTGTQQSQSTPTPTPPKPNASGDTQSGPGNSAGRDAINVNTDVSRFTLDTGILNAGNLFSPTVSGHIGFGHAGQGGTFTVVLWGQSLGIGLFGIGDGPPTHLWQADVPTGGDNDWTGYGTDFDHVPLGSVLRALGGKIKLWATIYDSAGVFYNQGQVQAA